MTTEEKDILFKDLCGRLPYGVICDLWMCKNPNEKITEVLKFGGLRMFHEDHINFNIKPYLRPMKSMTANEEKVFLSLSDRLEYDNNTEDVVFTTNAVDWLNEHHFDYRGLIHKDLANAAPEEMYS